MITENLSTLQIHKLTQEQYNRELDAGRIDEHAIYLTPGEEIDLSRYLPHYYSLADLNLVSGVNTGAICAALPINSVFLHPANKTSITDLPVNWGTLEIVKTDSDNFCTAKLTRSDTSNVEIYLGKYSKNQSPNWSGWRKLDMKGKPSGSYVGNGAASRDIMIGADYDEIGKLAYIYASDFSYEGFAMRHSSIAWHNFTADVDQPVDIVNAGAQLVDSQLFFQRYSILNKYGVTYYYQVL